MAGAQVPGDLALTADGKEIPFSTGPELTRDRLYVAFGTGQSSYLFNLDFGFPFQQVFALRGDEIATLQTIFVRWLLSFDFVLSVDEVAASYNQSDRTYSISFSATSTEGRITDTLTIGVL